MKSLPPMTSSPSVRVEGQGDEQRVLYAPFRDTDKESLKLKWVDHNGEAKRITPGDPGNIGMASPGIIAVETLTQLYDNFVNHADPRTITLSGEEVKGGHCGLLRPRTLVITGLYPIGRESNRLLGPREGGEADDLLEPAILFQLDAKTTTAPAPVSPARHIRPILARQLKD